MRRAPWGEKTKFWVPGERPSKSGRREKQEIKKQEQNEQSAEKSMARLLNANFCQGDLLLGLDYSEEGLERILSWAREQGMNVDGSEEERMDAVRAAAEHELRLVLRRVKREMAKAGLVLRYVAVTSDMDGDTGETVRVHITWWCRRRPGRPLWRSGPAWAGLDWSPLSAQEDYTPIAAYLIRQVRRVPDAKKYVSSRNLVRPQPRGPGGADGRGAASAPRGETAAQKRVQAGQAPVHPLCAAGGKAAPPAAGRKNCIIPTSPLPAWPGGGRRAAGGPGGPLFCCLWKS